MTDLADLPPLPTFCNYGKIRLAPLAVHLFVVAPETGNRRRHYERAKNSSYQEIDQWINISSNHVSDEILLHPIQFQTFCQWCLLFVLNMYQFYTFECKD